MKKDEDEKVHTGNDTAIKKGRAQMKITNNSFVEWMRFGFE